MEKIEVGQILYRDKNLSITEYTVSKVGKKYLYLDIPRPKDYPVNIEDLTYRQKNYGQFSFKLYKTKQEIYDYHERVYLTRQVTDIARNGFGKDITLEQLREIGKILGVKSV